MNQEIHGKDVPTGVVLPFFGRTLPKGYTWANRQLIDKLQYNKLHRTLTPNIDEFGDTFRVPTIDDEYILNKEYPTNKLWVNGERIYRYGITIDAFPNTTTDTYDLSSYITPVTVTNIHGYMNNGTITFIVPVTDSTGDNDSVNVWMNPLTSLKIRTNWDTSGYSGYIFVEYTKTSIKSKYPRGIIKV